MSSARDLHGDDHLREESIGALLKQLSEQTSTLVRQELELARAELTVKGKEAGIGAGMVGAATVLGLAALGALTAAAIAALATGMATWLAALIVFAIYAVAAGVMALIGKNRVTAAVPPAPQTVETLKEDVQWAKSQSASAKK